MNSYKIKFSKIILVIGTISVFILFVLKFSDIKTVISILLNIHYSYLFLALVTQLFTYLSIAYLFNVLLKIHNKKVNGFNLVKSILATTFINVAFPSGGISGNSFLFYFFYKEKVKKSISVVTVLLFYMFNNLSFYFFLFGVDFYLILKKEITFAEVVASIISVAITVVTTLIVFLIIRRRALFNMIALKIFNIINRISGRIIKRDIVNKNQISLLVKEFYIGWKDVAKSKISLLHSFMGAIFVHIFDILTVYIIFRALGYNVSIPVLIIGFVIADIFSFVSLVPSGFGVLEVSLTLIYTGFGVPLEIAALTVLIFRFLSLWLPIPIGMWSYRNLVNQYKKSK